MWLGSCKCSLAEHVGLGRVAKRLRFSQVVRRVQAQSQECAAQPGGVTEGTMYHAPHGSGALPCDHAAQKRHLTFATPRYTMGDVNWNSQLLPASAGFDRMSGGWREDERS